MKISKASLLLLLFLQILFGISCGAPAEEDIVIDHLLGEMAGELTSTSVVLQSRLTGLGLTEDGDVPGRAGIARFEVSRSADFAGSFYTSWLRAEAASDYIVKVRVMDLDSGARYYYRLEWGPNESSTLLGETREFRTHPGSEAAAPSRFVVVTGMHYGRFRESPRGQEPDAPLGYPALVSILERSPDFFVGTGDNVYYDHMPEVQDVAGMRKKWHEQFVQQRYVDLFSNVPTYWEKDDHDLRYDDCDTTDTPKDPERIQTLPSMADGLRIFREQLPLADPADENPLPYRTHRISKDLQIWLTEGRDFRSPNLMPDGPAKTMWGVEQREWLKRTLLESDATFKIIISPTPMVGPDDLRKKDNHTNIGGFRHEGDAFFAWATENGFLEKGLYFVCGDRHWQYHAEHPSGFEEFSSGALVDGNSRLGVAPGDLRGTDPEALIVQHFTSPEPSGGFLEVEVEPGEPATLRFNFFDENGVPLYSTEKQR